MVWIGYSKNVRLPVIALPDATLTKELYIDFLEKQVVPFLKSKRKWRTSVLQQDGARPHTSNFSMEKLKTLFPGGIISDRAEFKWPAFSPRFFRMGVAQEQGFLTSSGSNVNPTQGENN